MRTRASERLKHYREARAVSQADLAAALGIAKNAISKIENGARRMSIEEAVGIAEVLRIRLEELAGVEHAQSEEGSGQRGVLAQYVRQGKAALADLTTAFTALELLLAQ